MFNNLCSTLIVDLLVALQNARPVLYKGPFGRALSRWGRLTNYLQSAAFPRGKISILIQHSLYFMMWYLIDRVNSNDKTHILFFKMQSSTKLRVHIVRKGSVPSAPWIFLHRDPEDNNKVVVSHLLVPNQSRAKCLQSKYNPPRRLKSYLE